MAALRHRKAWEQRDIDHLRWNWSDKSPDRIGQELGRTPRAVLCMARKLRLVAPSVGTTSLRALAEKTGYDYRTLCNVAKKMKIQIRRIHSIYSKKGKRYRWSTLSNEQIAKILGFLKKKPDAARVRQQTVGAWNEMGRGGFVKPAACVVCERNDVPHYCKRYCKRCYDRQRKSR
jgi:hypothetical protein